MAETLRQRPFSGNTGSQGVIRRTARPLLE
jgi:hypothetical protein